MAFAYTYTHEVLFRATKGDHRWQFGRIDGKYCWWSHTSGQQSTKRWVDTKSELLNLVRWFKNQGWCVTEVTQ